MVAFAIKEMGGMIPRLDDEVLPLNRSSEAVDCDLRPSAVDGLPQRIFQTKLAAGTKKAYRFVDPHDHTLHTWLSLPSLYSSVVRNPVPNDVDKRIYWTNPGDLTGPFFSTYDIVSLGEAPYQLGISQPEPGFQLVVSAVGGTTDGSIPFDERVYVFTYVNDFQEESAPSSPSVLVAGPPDATWTVTGMPTTPVGNPPDKPDYPPVRQLNLYRTVVGASGSVDYYLVQSFNYITNPPPAAFVDPYSDFEVSRRTVLPSATWANPPQALDGLVALPNGMLAGFTNNTIHFCEPFHPHAWPAIYDQSVMYDVSAMTVWQGSLIILTEGFPSTGAGRNPANFQITQIQVSEPCVSRGSVVTTLQGVFYASQNGLVLMTYAGLVNATYQTMTKNIWLDKYSARTLMACRHRSQYMAIDQKDAGFIVDVQESQLGFLILSDQVKDVVNLWDDEQDGNVYMITDDGSIYLWDNELQPLRPFRWKSKHFNAPKGISLGAAHILLDPSVADTLPVLSPPVQDPTLELPEGVNAIFRLYVGNPLNLVMTRQLSKANDVFRLISGFMAFDWQCEVVSRVRLTSIELASTMKELQGV